MTARKTNEIHDYTSVRFQWHHLAQKYIRKKFPITEFLLKEKKYFQIVSMPSGKIVKHITVPSEDVSSFLNTISLFDSAIKK